MLFVLKLAWRNLQRNRRRTLLTTLSITFGLGVMIYIASLIEGSYLKSLHDTATLAAGHVTVEHPGYRDDPSPNRYVPSVSKIKEAALKLPDVEYVKTFVASQGVLASGRGAVGLTMMGVDFAVEAAVSPLAKRIVRGHYLSADEPRGAVVGKGLADRLQLEPGSRLVITTTDSKGELNSELLRVSGIFDTGAIELDNYLVHVPLPLAQRVLGLGPDQANQVGLLLKLATREPEVRAALTAALGESSGVTVHSWRQVIPDLAGWVDQNNTVGRVQEIILIVLVALTVLNTVLMSVVERSREFAVLLAVGTPPRQLRQMVVAETLLVGLLGTCLGALLGSAASYWGHLHGLDLRSSSLEGLSLGGFSLDLVFRNELTLTQVVTRSALVLLNTVVIGCYPAFRATRISLPELLRS